MPPAHRRLAERPGDFAVAVLPAYDSRDAAWAMLWATTHGKRLVNGAFVFITPTVQALADAEDLVDADALVAILRSIYPLRYVIVNRTIVPGPETAMWARVDREQARGVAFIGRFGDEDVFAITGTPQRATVLRRWFSADFVRRHSRAEYALTLAGTDPGATRRIEVRFNGRLLATHDGPARGAVSLDPPYRTGDRNELAFAHLYALHTSVTQRPEYRIGRTATHAPVDIAVTSAAEPYGSRVSILVNGQELVEGVTRGYVVAALEAQTGTPVGVGSFDTFEDPSESRRLARFLDGLPAGTIVVAAVRDEASRRLEESGVRALQSIGAREDLRGRFRVSHAVIGVKGATPGDAIEAAGPGLLRVSVGQPRLLEAVLESFELR